MRQCDESAYRTFVGARYGSLLRFAGLLTADRGQAEDLVQEALTRLYTGPPAAGRVVAGPAAVHADSAAGHPLNPVRRTVRPRAARPVDSVWGPADRRPEVGQRARARRSRSSSTRQ